MNELLHFFSQRVVLSSLFKNAFDANGSSKVGSSNLQLCYDGELGEAEDDCTDFCDGLIIYLFLEQVVDHFGVWL